MKTIIFIMFTLLLIVSMICAQNIISGRIIVKFEKNISNFPPTEKGKLALSEFNIHSNSIRNTLNQIEAMQFEKVFKDCVPADTVVINRRTNELIKVPDLSQVYLIHFNDSYPVTDAVKIFRNLPGVIYAHPDYMVQEADGAVNDPGFDQQWYLDNSNDYDVNAPEAWEITHGDPNVIIALIEKGVDKFHVDLASKSYGGEYDENSDRTHGTKVAGVAAAHTNNLEGIASLSYECRFMPRKSDGGLNGRSNDIASSADDGADIINCSFSLWENNNYSVLIDAIEHAFLSGSVIVASMGNASNHSIPYTAFPASYEEAVLAVGGTDQNDNWYSGHSNYGSYIDVSAPAVDILTTLHDPPNSYGSVNGTSFSAPLTSALAGLLLSINPSLTPDDIERIIELSAKDRGQQGWDQYTGFGRIDARAALNLIRPPNSVTHIAATGGSKVKTVDNAIYSIYNELFASIATGNYFGDEYKVTKTVTFPTQYVNPPKVWVRIAGFDKNGWPPHHPNFSVSAKPYVEVKNLTTTGCTFETYIYDVWDVTPEYLGYVPCEASDIKFNYTLLGIPIAAPIISGFTQTPIPIYTNGTVRCNLSQGSSPLTYNWSKHNVPQGVNVTFSGNTASITYSPGMRIASVQSSPRAEEFYLSCTVSNSAGSSTSSFSPFIVYQQGGCPFVYTWNGEVYVEDNNILPQSQYPENLDNDVTDFYHLFTEPALDTVEERYRLGIGEFEQEQTFLDQVQLWVVDHEPGTFITVDDSGSIVQFADPAIFVDAQLDSQDVLKILQENDSITVEVVEGETLELYFDGGGEELEEGLLIIGQVHQHSSKENIAAYVMRQEEGRDLTFEVFRFRRNPSYSWVLVPASDTSSVQINIEWLQDSELDYAEYSAIVESPFDIYVTQLLDAQHSVDGNVTALLAQTDENYVELVPGEWITLEFGAPPPNAEMERTFIFVSRGRYEAIDMQAFSKGNVIASVESMPANIPQKFEVSQNYPNPFNPETTIRFGIPEDRQVKLTIYSVTGEKVITLVDNFVQSGYHEVVWDGRNQNGIAVSSGIYVYMIQAGDEKVFKKMMLVR